MAKKDEIIKGDKSVLKYAGHVRRATDDERSGNGEIKTLKRGLIEDILYNFLFQKTIKPTPLKMRTLYDKLLSYAVFKWRYYFPTTTAVIAELKKMGVNDVDDFAEFIQQNADRYKCKIIDKLARLPKSCGVRVGTKFKWYVKEVSEIEYAAAPKEDDDLYYRVRSQFGDYPVKLYKYTGPTNVSPTDMGKACRRFYVTDTGCNYFQVREISASSWEMLPDDRKYKTSD